MAGHVTSPRANHFSSKLNFFENSRTIHALKCRQICFFNKII